MRLFLRFLLFSLLAIPVLGGASARGQGCPPRGTEYFDGVTPPALPMGWVASQGVNATGAPLWVTTSVASHSWPNDAFSTAPDNILDNRLDTPLFSADPFAPGISFWNNYNLESGRDGAVLEISSPNINGGAFTDITDPAVGGSVAPGYNSVISSAFQSPIAGRMAWSGNSGGYVLTQVYYSNAALPPSQVRLRFRLVTDNSGASEGWRIDTFTFQSNECPPPPPTPTPCPLQPWTFVADYPLGVISYNAMGSNGTFAYSAGGNTFPSRTDAFYRYDPVANSWTTLASLPVALSGARGVYASSTNSFYVFGGDSQTGVLDTTYIYHVGTNTWTTGAPMPAARYWPNVVYAAGKIFVIGGHGVGSDENQTWEYDPMADTWNTARANIPAPMTGSAASTFGQFIYLVSHASGAGSTLHYRYDITFNAWTLMAPAPATLYLPTGAVIGQQMFVVGGPNLMQGHTGTYIYNIGTNSWTTGPNTTVGHSYAGGTAIGNRLLMVGGYNYGAANTNIVEMTMTDCAPPTPSPTPTITPTPTATATPSATVSPTSTPSPTPSPTASPSPTPAHALNISTRLRVETGDRVAIGGFIITGSAPKKVAVRGIGPSLGSSGLSDVLADPTLELRGPSGELVIQNDNWQDDAAQAAQLTALGLALPHPNESGMVATLEPGPYTALMFGKNLTSGLGLVEIYDADTAADSQLANISTRGYVQTADNVMIGGFILGNGSASVDVVVRGLGPSLDRFMLIDVLADPTLELHDGNGALLIANDDWQDDPVSAAQLIAHGFQPPNALESGIFITLPPGVFTAILAGKNDVGLGLVEVYRDPRTFVVTNTADSGPGSLRDTIAAARDGDTIVFSVALKEETITLTSGELLIDKNITIYGPGPDLLAISKSSSSPPQRIFHVMPGRTVTIEGLTISNGSLSETDAGGGVRNDQATLTLNNCAVVSNFGGQFGGGIYNDGGTANLTIFNCTIGNNRAGLVGGSPGGAFGGGIYNNNGTLEISDSTISGNFANERCGGVYNSVSGTLSIRDSVVDGNTVMFRPPFVERAGGIFNAGTAEITNCTISHNAGVGQGGGVDNQGSLTITNSTLNNNTVVDSGGGISNSGPLTITNSTISGNSASFKGFGNGGGIYNGNATLTITNSTISGNSVGSFDGFGGGIYLSVGTLQIENTILNASGTGGNIFNNSGTVTSHGYNLSSDDGSGFLNGPGDQINTDPMLGPLQNNGGPTFTYELLTGSPAINAGDPNFSPPPLYDQRGPGYDRVVGGRIDVGSFEVQP